MRIESINLNQEDFDHMGVGLSALPPLQMRNLGKCVIVAGKNGAGKTRLLKQVEQLAGKYLTKEDRQQIELQVRQQKASQKANEIEAERIRREELRQGEVPAEQQAYERNAASCMAEVDRLQKALKVGNVLSIQGPGKPKIVSFVPRSTALKDPFSMTDSEAENLAQSFATSLSAQGADGGAPAYARKIMRAAMVEKLRQDDKEQPIGKSQQAEQELLGLFQMLLGKEVQIELGEDLNLRLKGLSDKYSSLLSEGQKVLFQFACMLHSGHGSIHDCIVFLDEPENHLHPAVLNELVDRLQELLTDGQLWISTHSVPLIAHLSAQDPNCLWFAEEGRFEPARRSPEKVLDSLLGGPDGARRVNDLTLLPSRFASSMFLRQCLLKPGVSGYRQDDPQLKQIRQELHSLRDSKQPLTIIDFGSGKGRLLDDIAQETDHRPLGDVVDYLAYEPYVPDAKECQYRCETLYSVQKTEQRVFSDLADLARLRGKKFADVVIVCNVLHEVHPDKWLGQFGGNSAVSGLLKDDGFILFVEDYALPIGECAHEFGFLLLNQDQLIELFGITSVDIDSNLFTRNDHQNPSYQGRLIAHLVSAQCLGRMTEKTQQRAIESLQEQSLKRLKELLESCDQTDAGSNRGRESALVTQLAANATLWIRDKANRNNLKGNDGYVQ